MPRSVRQNNPMGAALYEFAEDVRRVYGARLKGLVLFGSRARGQAGPASDADVAVILDVIDDRSAERLQLADLAYDRMAVTAVEIQPWPVSWGEWQEPGLHRNPALIHSMRRDGQTIAVH